MYQGAPSTIPANPAPANTGHRRIGLATAATRASTGRARIPVNLVVSAKPDRERQQHQLLIERGRVAYAAITRNDATTRSL